MGKILIFFTALLFWTGCASVPPDAPNVVSAKSAIKQVSAEQAAVEAAKPGVQFIDVRTPPEYKSGRAAGSKNFPMEDLEKWVATLDKERPVVIICETGRRSQIVADDLKSAGYTSLYNVVGGFSSWSKAGLPVEK